jgi:hypothetical protein
MLLTCVALAKRVFLGGVTVYGVLSGTQNTPLPLLASGRSDCRYGGSRRMRTGL